MRVLKMKSVLASHRKLTTTNWEPSSKLILLQLHETLLKNSTLAILRKVTQHLKETRKVKKLRKWVSHELTGDQKKSFWSVVFSYSTQWWTISQMDCNVQWKVDFIWHPATSSSVAGLRSSKALPEANSHPKKGHGHCLVVCCLSDPLQLSESQQNCYIWEACSANWWDAPKTALPAVCIVKQKGPIFSSMTMSNHTWHNQCFKSWKSWAMKFCHVHLISRQLTTSSILTAFCREKCCHNQQEAEIAFQEFVKCWSTDFYAKRINKFISHWKNCVDCNSSSFE